MSSNISSAYQLKLAVFKELFPDQLSKLSSSASTLIYSHPCLYLSVSENIRFAQLVISVKGEEVCPAYTQLLRCLGQHPAYRRCSMDI